MTTDELAILMLIAIGLAMDCFAVSVTRGIATKKNRMENALALAASFGVFQAAMTLAGWQIGKGLINLISGVDHWVAFALLALVGCKMVYESGKDGEERDIKPLNLSLLLMLSVATSIDAFAVGLSIAFLKISVLTAALLIGAVSFAMSFSGFFIGCGACRMCGGRAETIGGLILIGIGLKIVIEHSLG